MKKNISINISGIIFYIEEDTYDELKNYLNSVEQYFSSYEDSKEIIADIETRMAEIFMSTLKDSKQVITPEDVQNLIATMGSVADFQAMEDDPAYQPVTSNPMFSGGTLELQTEAEYQESLKAQQATSQTSSSQKTRVKEKEELVLAAEDRQTIDYSPQYTGKNPLKSTRPRRLYRDGKHQVLGGVASGLAHYFNLDAMWVRLIFIALTFGLFMFPAFPISVIASYIVLWMVMPYNNKLEENPRIKKFYRDGKQATIGGVVSGLSHYVGIELSLLRILFVLGIFLGGFSLILYTVLWVISPEAKSLTDRMRMEGEPITLKNIDSSIRKKINVPKGKGTYSTTKAGQIVMFPFKMAGVLINSLSPLIRPFFVLASESIRIGGGALAFIIGLGSTIGLTVGVIFALGNFQTEHIHLGPIPARFFYNSVEMPGLLSISTYFTLLIPSIFAIGLGISLLLRRWVMRARFSWTMLGLWVVSLIGMAVTMPPNIANFQYRNTAGNVKYYNFKGKKPITLDLNLSKGMSDYKGTTLTLEGYKEDAFKLETNFSATGSSYQTAATNAAMLSYGVEQVDDALLFDRDFVFKPNAKFRAQRNSMKLHIPFEQPFIMTRSLRRIIRNTIHRNGYQSRDMDGKNVWKFIESGKLVCTTCKSKEVVEEQAALKDIERNADFNKAFNIGDFKSLNLGGVFNVVVEKSNETSFRAYGRQSDLEKIKITQDGDELKISLKKQSYLSLGSKKITLKLRTPHLNHINISGACKFNATGFKEDKFVLDASGASKIQLRDGSANKMIVNISGASKVSAYDFKVKEATMELSGASKVYVDVKDKLFVDASGASKVRYRGNPEVKADNSGVSSVRKDD